MTHLKVPGSHFGIVHQLKTN